MNHCYRAIKKRKLSKHSHPGRVKFQDHQYYTFVVALLSSLTENERNESEANKNPKRYRGGQNARLKYETSSRTHSPALCVSPFGNLKLKLNSSCFWDSVSLIIKNFFHQVNLFTAKGARKIARRRNCANISNKNIK